MTDKVDYIANNMSAFEAFELTAGSAIKATVFTAIVGFIAIYGVLNIFIEDVLPYSIIPAIAFTYMAKKWYSDLPSKLVFGVASGIIFGITIRLIGYLLVVLVDTIGFQNTVFVSLVEAGSLVLWLYMDLTSWVQKDIEYKERAAARQREKELKQDGT